MNPDTAAIDLHPSAPDPNRLNCYLCNTSDRGGPVSRHRLKYCRECLAYSNVPLCESMLEQWKTLRRARGLSAVPYSPRVKGTTA